VTGVTVIVGIFVDVLVGVTVNSGVGVAGLFRVYVSIIAPVRVINRKTICHSLAPTSIAP
jgi:hypothetical protein